MRISILLVEIGKYAQILSLGKESATNHNLQKRSSMASASSIS